jgi:glycosyltransferase involved in cell wall biosynthesis
MKIPLVSVLMPIHGRTPFLKEAIESVLSQTYSDLHLVIIFDRPDENARKIVNEFELKDSRVMSFNSENPGISNALNLGIEQTTSPFLARIDCDDLMEKNRVEIQIKCLANEEAIVCIGSQLQIIDSTGAELRLTHYPTESNSIEKSLKIRNVIAHPSVMYRREAVFAAGLYRSEFNGAEDYDLWLRLAKIGKIINIQTPLTKYRIHNNQFSYANRSQQIYLDSRVRDANSTEGIFNKLELFCALQINLAIAARGFSRLLHAALALLVVPHLFIHFLIYQVRPEVTSK